MWPLATWKWTLSTELVLERMVGRGKVDLACPETSAPPHMVSMEYVTTTHQPLPSSPVLIKSWTSISLSIIRYVHAPVPAHSACCRGCIWHRAGFVMAARRERGKCTCPSLPGGLHQVSQQLINCSSVKLTLWNFNGAMLLQMHTQALQYIQL